MVASFLVVALKFGFDMGIVYDSFRFDCVVGGYVRGCVRVFIPGVEAVDLGFNSRVATKYALNRRGVRFANRFTIPAYAL